jgi:hypothetical protein
MTRILGSSFSLQQKQVRSDMSCYVLHCSALTHCCILLTQRQGGWTRHLGLRWTSRSPLISHICTLFYRSSLKTVYQLSQLCFGMTLLAFKTEPWFAGQARTVLAANAASHTTCEPSNPCSTPRKLVDKL